MDDFHVLESVPDAILIARQDGRIAWVNRIAERLFGYPREELLGRPVEMLLPDSLRAAHVAHRAGFHGAPRTRSMGIGLLLRGLRRSGEEFEVEISLSPLRAGEETWALAAVRDVTERRKLEDMARLWRNAQDEVRERDELLSVASHELRTPLTAIHLQLHLLQRTAVQADGGPPETLAAQVEGLERQCRRLALLLDELLDVSRMRLGLFELHLEDVDLAELARETVSQLSEQGRRLGSEIALEARESPGRWDRIRVVQVITNLLANAIKFGEGKPIAVSVEPQDARVRLVVRDQGIGIAPEDQVRVFQRFERAVSAPRFTGLGLGLYIVRRIVEAHGGSITLASAPGQGTAFTVDLPRAPAAAVLRDR